MHFYNCDEYIQDLKETVYNVKDISSLANSSILITGASGLIGSFITDVLLMANNILNLNITIYALGRSKKRLMERFASAEKYNLIYIENDVTNEINFNFSVDYIIHAASNAYPAAFNSDPVGTIISNITGTKELLDYGRSHGMKRFLFISSGEIYGDATGDITAYKERYSGYVDPLNPRSCYPISKRAAETLCCAYKQQFDVDSVIVRPSHTYGITSTRVDNRANVQFLQKALQKEDIVLKSAGTQMRSYTYIADCVSGILTVLLRGTSGEAYNIANSASRVTIARFAELLAKEADVKILFEKPNEIEVTQQTFITRQILDSEKLESLGWEGKYPIENGISRLWKIAKKIYEK